MQLSSLQLVLVNTRHVMTMLSSWVSNGSLDQCTTAITVVQSELLQSFPISQTLITDFFYVAPFLPYRECGIFQDQPEVLYMSHWWYTLCITL